MSAICVPIQLCVLFQQHISLNRVQKSVVMHIRASIGPYSDQNQPRASF
jgi:hypothetical protein